jgi:hypothetical protein
LVCYCCICIILNLKYHHNDMNKILLIIKKNDNDGKKSHLAWNIQKTSEFLHVTHEIKEHRTYFSLVSSKNKVILGGKRTHTQLLFTKDNSKEWILQHNVVHKHCLNFYLMWKILNFPKNIWFNFKKFHAKFRNSWMV